MVNAGEVLSTVNVALAAEPEAEFPAWSVAVPAAIEIPKVPFAGIRNRHGAYFRLRHRHGSVVPFRFKITLAAVKVLELKLSSA